MNQKIESRSESSSKLNLIMKSVSIPSPTELRPISDEG